MITIHHNATIQRLIDEVFAYVSDSCNDPAWCPPVKEVTQTSGTGPGQDATYEMVSQPGPFPLKGQFRIVNYKPLQRVEYEGSNAMIKFDYSYQFEEKGPGATQVTMTSHLHPKGLWKVLTPMIRSGSEKVAVEEFEKLKGILEG